MQEDISLSPKPNNAIEPVSTVATTLTHTPPIQNPVTSPVSDDPELSTTVHPEDLDIKWARWKCLVCGYTYEGRNLIKKCPRCGNEDPDKFEDTD